MKSLPDYDAWLESQGGADVLAGQVVKVKLRESSVKEPYHAGFEVVEGPHAGRWLSLPLTESWARDALHRALNTATITVRVQERSEPFMRIAALAS